MTPAEYLLYANTALASLAILGHLKSYFSSGEKTLGEKLATAEKTLSEKLASIDKKLDERLTKVESKLVEYDRRIQSLEGEMKHLPTREAQHKLEVSMEKMSGRMDTLVESLKPIAATSGRLQEFLLEQVQK